MTILNRNTGSTHGHDVGSRPVVWLALGILLTACSPDDQVVGPGAGTANTDTTGAADMTVNDGTGAVDSTVVVVDAGTPVPDATDPLPDADSPLDAEPDPDVDGPPDADPDADPDAEPDVDMPLDGGADDTAAAPSTLCNPCNSSNECGDASVCVDRQAYGAFCGLNCVADADCPAGYSCLDATSIEGDAGKRCMPTPQSASGPPGPCTCSEAAIANQLSTTCYQVKIETDGKPVNKCKGTRKCTETGLSDCDAPEPQDEICDGADNDCDGQIDDGVGCDDGNVCSKDTCNGAAGCAHTPELDGGACDDGDGCTGGDTCVLGACKGGAQKECDDSDACTSDSCDPGTGKCAFSPIAGCGEGCKTDSECPQDGDPCTSAFCDGATGKCAVKAASDACDDGNACTKGDVCNAGKCVSGKAVDCTDSNPCTVDACDVVSGDCGHTPAANGGACDDGDACTTQDGCLAGTCAGSIKSCDDGDGCTADSCDPVTGACKNSAIVGCGAECKADADCKADGNPCTQALCDAQSGKCQAKAIVGGCNDGDNCTTGDNCQDGKCVGLAKDCEDGDVCTVGSCDASSGACAQKPVAGEVPCSDGSACTAGDVCVAGKCKSGKSNDCDDNKPCTKDACDDATGLCSHANAAGACDDGNACTVGDTCTTGACAAGQAKSCDDNDDCTADSCAPATGACSHNAIPGCGAKCKTDSECNPTGQPCTKAVCDNAAGCVVAAKAGACDDGLPCTTGDACDNGKCVAGSAKDCDDNNVCTTDACDAKTGNCGHVAVNKPTACSDDDPCTLKDQCLGSACKSGTAKDCDDGESCTIDSCHAASGVCVHTPAVNSAGCSDGNPCTGPDGCAGGKCATGPAKDCNDGDACTIDSCDKATGSCAHNKIMGCGGNCASDADCKADGNPCTANTCQGGQCKITFTSTLCTDNNACTSGDKCSAGSCQPGAAKSCADGNACTDDACDKTSGNCSNSPSAAGSPCSDGNACTSGDTCLAGACQAGGAKSCDDSNACTADGCQNATGLCIHTPVPNGLPCSDGTACTVGDGCNGGKCASGAPKGCSDNDPCTTDLCNPANGACSHNKIIGCGGNCAKEADCPEDKNPCTTAKCDGNKGKCTFVPATGACDDGDNCTVGDACNGGQCQGSAKSCDDNNVCTTDACKAGACLHTPVQAGASCSDGELCTVGDACKSGLCVPGAAKICVTGEVCTTAACDAKTGDCVTTFVNPGAPCSDDNACTLKDGCDKGKCQPGAAKNCDDGKSCTLDACNSKTGQCSHDDIPGCGGFCLHDGHCGSDGNPCTKSVCDVAANKCVTQPDINPCDDGNPCTNKDKCVNSACQGQAKSCSDNNGCTVDTCAAGSGKCNHVAVSDGTSCTDNNVCTSGDSCKQGQCVPATTKSCDDNNTCTADSCNKQTGDCLHVPDKNGQNCNDGDACTTLDVCANGSCQGGAVMNCADNDPCTADACQGGKCLHTPINGCGGNCAKDADCKSDGNVCTGAVCDMAAGKCTSKNVDGACDDGKPCTTGDKCVAGQCLGTAKDCDDKNVCTADSCNAATGACIHAPLGQTTVCDDGKPCTISDRCDKGSCKAGAAKVCDDNNVCTVDVCNPSNGNCDVSPAPSGTSCDDGNKCTTGETCKTKGKYGYCGGGKQKNCNDNDKCTTDACDVTTGQCKNTPVNGCGGNCAKDGDCPQNICAYMFCGKNGKCAYKPLGGQQCDDGNPCTIKDYCAKKGACSGYPKTCASNNPCATGVCEANTGNCINTPANDGGSCNDGNACTANETCAGGKCGDGVPKDCSDNNACTTDQCSSKTGNCSHNNKPAGTGCSDGDACTTGDACASGACLPGTPKTCNDGEPCTADSCDGNSGNCSYTKIPGCGGYCKADGDCKEDNNPCTKAYCNAILEACSFKNENGQVKCDDGNPCTTADKCGKGICAGDAKTCDDGNPCTVGSCNAATGACSQTAGSDSIPCDDGNGCTQSDACSKGICVGAKPKNCSDGNVCTTESCNAKTGQCIYQPTAKGTPCSDGNPCTEGDSCDTGVCKVGAPAKCDDNDPCTADTCWPGGKDAKCQHAPIPGCGGNCAQDSHCPPPNPGKGGTAACLASKCNLAQGKCETVYLTIPCKDNNPCTENDTCNNGQCIGSPTNCDDGSNCTKEWCEAWQGCQYHVFNNGQGCNDGDPCTYADTCNAGKCSGSIKSCDDVNSCTADSCNPNTGACIHTPINGCGGNCTNNSHCKQNGQSGPCLQNLCDVGIKKCVLTAVNGKCNDNNPCTVNDSCESGACKSGPPKTCNDNNACTTDRCDLPTGNCVHATIKGCTPCFGGGKGGACNDNNACTNDVCQAGVCANLTIPNCKLCDSYPECNDNNACTTDACLGGRCYWIPIFGCQACAKNLDCLDSNPCTTDKCEAGGFCSHSPIPLCIPCKSNSDCNDGNKCTTDSCTSGSCAHTPVPGC